MDYYNIPFVHNHQSPSTIEAVVFVDSNPTALTISRSTILLLLLHTRFHILVNNPYLANVCAVSGRGTPTEPPPAPSQSKSTCLSCNRHHLTSSLLIFRSCSCFCCCSLSFSNVCKEIALYPPMPFGVLATFHRVVYDRSISELEGMRRKGRKGKGRGRGFFFGTLISSWDVGLRSAM